jgi:branched-chain amino acid transport system substrate-binding protein
MQRKKNGLAARLWLAGLSVLLFLLVGCAPGEEPTADPGDPPAPDAEEPGEQPAGQPATGEPVPLGGVIDQTAYLADFDGAVREGITLAIDAVNEGGGVLDGRPLEVSFVDMEADPAQGLRAVQRLVTEGVAAILHGFTSASTRAAQPVLEESQVPMIVASVLPDNEEYVFSTIPPAEFETGIRADWLLEQDLTQVGVLSDGTPYNELQMEVLQGVEGLDVVGAEQHTPDAVDLRPQITSLLRAGAEVIVKFSAGPTNIVAAQGMSQLGADVPLVTGIDNLQALTEAAGLYEQFYTVVSAPQAFEVLPEEDRSESLVNFMQLYEDAGLQEDPTYIGRGWDAVFLVAQAIEAAGSDDSAEIAQALIDMDPYEGASGTFSFTEESHYGFDENPYYVAEFGPDGALNIVYFPEES